MDSAPLANTNSTTQKPPLVAEFQEVAKFYQMGTEQVHALAGVSVAFERGSFWAVMGPSGSGKSTMLNLLGCLDRPSSGRYILEGGDVGELNDDRLSEFRLRHLGFIFQSFNLIGDLTVYQNVELPLRYRGLPPGERRKRVLEALEKVEMPHRQNHYPSQLSGGQQQRVAVARAVAGDPSILLADEPTGNLDSRNGEAVMELLRGLHGDGATICIVTHDPRYALHAERTIQMFDGKIIDEQRARAA